MVLITKEMLSIGPNRPGETITPKMIIVQQEELQAQTAIMGPEVAVIVDLGVQESV